MRAWFPFRPGFEALGFQGLYVVKLCPLLAGLLSALVAVAFEAGVERFRFLEGWVMRVFCRVAQFPEGTNDLEGLLSEATSAVFVVELMMSVVRNECRNFFAHLKNGKFTAKPNGPG
jgi:hypothetical protein